MLAKNKIDGAIRAPEPSLFAFEERLIDQFRKRRQLLGLTQTQLQEKIGVADNLISKWEVGMRKPSGFLLFCWADALGCELKLEEKDNGKILQG